MSVIDWALRPQCAGCGAPTRTPCATCRGSLEGLPPDEDPLATPLDGIAAPWRFGGALAAAIRRLKFDGRTHVARDLAPLWSPLLEAAAGDALVVPVPLHWRRRMSRGFDQAWLLALHACEHAGLPRPRAVLRRIRATPPQTSLSADERRSNLHGAFALRVPAATLAGARVVLVDDVITTGSTLAAAARPLLDAGVASVVGIALARATSGYLDGAGVAG